MAMLLSLIGTPSPIFYSTLTVVRALAKVAVGDHDVVGANTLEEVRTRTFGLAQPRQRCLVLFSDYPQPDVLPAFTDAGAPLVVCADGFLAIAHYSVVWRNYGGVDAARFASMGLVNIEPVITAPPEASLIVNDPDLRLSELIPVLAKVYGLPFDDDATRAVLVELGRPDGAGDSLGAYAAQALPAAEPARALLERRSPLENELLDCLAPQYSPIARGRRLESLEWPAFALLRPDYPDRLTVGPIDLTGPARFIHYGPYFALPRGRWRADLVLEVSECLSDNRLGIDIVSGVVLAVVKAKLPPEGVFGCAISLRFRDPSHPGRSVCNSSPARSKAGSCCAASA